MSPSRSGVSWDGRGRAEIGDGGGRPGDEEEGYRRGGRHSPRVSRQTACFSRLTLRCSLFFLSCLAFSALPGCQRSRRGSLRKACMGSPEPFLPIVLVVVLEWMQDALNVNNTMR
jgi:hypothetical protein